MRKIVIALAALLGFAGLLVPAASAAEPYCGITWGSQLKQDWTHTSAPITNARAGRQDCYDRLVIDLGQGTFQSGYYVHYVPAVYEQGSGKHVPLAGGAFLEVIAFAPAHDANYNPTYSPPDRMNAVNVSGFQTFRQVAFLGTFEGQTQFGMGVRARLPFRVFTLAGPGTGSRLVIDVAHQW